MPSPGVATAAGEMGIGKDEFAHGLLTLIESLLLNAKSV